MDEDDPSPSLLREMTILESALLLTKEGRWLHEGAPVTHRGLERALHRWLALDEESGRFVLEAGAERCFVTVEDAPYVVRGVALAGSGEQLRVFLRLTDESEEELSYASLRQSSDNVLYCDVKGGTMRARFDRAAYYKLAEHVRLDDDEPVLHAAGKLWPIPSCD